MTILNSNNKLFFELIRVAVNTLVCLSKLPSESEWRELYSMVKMQSMLGVCFAGIRRCKVQHQSPPKILYMQWMGIAVKIQQRNEMLNTRCMELQSRLMADGFKNCILKCQGIAQLYREELNALRQLGDIDVLWTDSLT